MQRDDKPSVHRTEGRHMLLNHGITDQQKQPQARNSSPSSADETEACEVEVETIHKRRRRRRRPLRECPSEHETSAGSDNEQLQRHATPDEPVNKHQNGESAKQPLADKDRTSKIAFHDAALNAMKLQRENKIPLITTQTSATQGESEGSTLEEGATGIRGTEIIKPVSETKVRISHQRQNIANFRILNEKCPSRTSANENELHPPEREAPKRTKSNFPSGKGQTDILTRSKLEETKGLTSENKGSGQQQSQPNDQKLGYDTELYNEIVFGTSNVVPNIAGDLRRSDNPQDPTAANLRKTKSGDVLELAESPSVIRKLLGTMKNFFRGGKSRQSKLQTQRGLYERDVNANLTRKNWNRPVTPMTPAYKVNRVHIEADSHSAGGSRRASPSRSRSRSRQSVRSSQSRGGSR